MTPAHYSHSEKSGAALIIALGFLAILTVMILTFAVQTRTERLSSRAYISTDQSRQLIHTALARAMADIDSDNGTNYPSFLAVGSPMTDTPARFLRDSIAFRTEEEYFPAGNSLISNAYAAAFNTASWQDVPENEPKALGRIGYVIINTSGLLDANTVGGLTNATALVARHIGLNPAEIPLSPSLLPELAATSQFIQPDGSSQEAETPAQAFIHNRQQAWKKFESVRDIKLLNTQARGNVIHGPVASFTTASLFPRTADNRIELNNALNAETFQDRLMTSCGLGETEARTVWENYQDYTDTNSLPVNILGSSPEAVPLINEIWVENLEFSQNARDPTNIAYEVSGELYVESWFPFEGDPPSVELELISGDPANLTNFVEIVEGEDYIGTNDFVAIHAAYSNGMAKSFILELVPDGIATTSDRKFSTAKYLFSYDDVVELDDPFTLDEVPGPDVILVEQHAVEISRLDRVEDVILSLPFNNNGTLGSRFSSCLDPRVNHSFNDPDFWEMDAPNTPNQINDIDDWGEESDLEEKEDLHFYVRNAPMKNAAELGHLSIGRPWSTIRLYSKDDGYEMHPVLDHFHAGESLWEEPVRPGLININSPHTNVLASAFLDTPFSINPDSTGSDRRIEPEQAKLLAGNLIPLSADQPQAGYAFPGNSVSNNLPNWNRLTDAQKDSIVANAYRLFGWRDTHYTILLTAQSGTDIDQDGRITDDEVRGTQKAVAYVWRDPLTGKAAVVFYGLSDTLQSTVGGGESWGAILQSFNPDA